MMLSESQGTVEHGTSKSGRWLEARRIRIAAWIAAAESIIVLFSSDVSKWTVIVIAVVSVLAWFAGRESSSHTVRQVLWIFAASQLLAVIAVSLGWIVKWAIILAVIVFAAWGLLYLFRDRGRRT
jgi:hypothetical protein